MPDDPPLVLVAATMWWPLSARLADAFLHHGLRVESASPDGHPLRFIIGVAKHYRYGGASSLDTLQRAIEQARPAIVVPCDDGVVWQLHTLHAKHPALRPLIERSLGPPAGYPILRSRTSLLQLAAELGIRVPVNRSIASLADLLHPAASLPAVLKLDGSCGGSGVAVVSSPEEASACFLELSAPITRSTAWKRMLIDQDPLPLWFLDQHQKPSVSIQQFIRGRPANAMIACWQGKVLAIIQVEVLSALGPTGAATVVRIIQHPEIAEAATLLAQKLELNGFHGLDFILEDETRAAYLIEFNPRPTQLGHLRQPVHGDLVGAFCAAFRGTPAPPVVDPISSDVIAFFPQAVLLNPDTPYLTSGYHDIPHQQPALHRELLRKPSPDRRFLARIYHLFRPRMRYIEARFSNEKSSPPKKTLRPV